MFLLLLQPHHHPCPDLPSWSACLDSLLDLSVPLGWTGASLCLEWGRGIGPGEVVEPSPCAHGHRLHLLHGTRYPHGRLSSLLFRIFQQFLCIGHAAAAARFAASSCTSCSTCWASPAWCWASLPSGCGKTMKADLTCTAFTPG